MKRSLASRLVRRSPTAGANTAAATGVVEGRVRAVDGSNAGGSFVFLYRKKTDQTLWPRGIVVGRDGRYEVRGVPPGFWRAYCLPNPALPLGAQTFRRRLGFDTPGADRIEVIAGSTTGRVNFLLDMAGKLRVRVFDSAGGPIPRVSLLVYEADAESLVQVPYMTGPMGQAIIPNVPIRSKLYLGAPEGFVSKWWNDKDTPLLADIIEIPSAGDGVTLTTILAPSG
jgi:hypothetical protein